MARDSTDQTFDDEEAQRRFEAALRGARAASSHPMTEFIGRGKRDAVRRKSRVKKTGQAKPK